MPAEGCSNQKRNTNGCSCTYAGCPRHGVCCECLRNHLKNQQLPACCFPGDVERTYDRSFAKFVETYRHLLK